MKKILFFFTTLSLVFFGFTGAAKEQASVIGKEAFNIAYPSQNQTYLAQSEAMSTIAFDLSCLDSYLNLTGTLLSILETQSANCHVIFANSPDEKFECLIYNLDMYNNMHGVAEAAYDRCKEKSTITG